MKFVSARDLKNMPGAVWAMLKQNEDIVLTSNGKPFALLVETDESNLEDHLKELRIARAKLALSRVRKQAQEAGMDSLSSKDVDSFIAEKRNQRRGRRR